VPRTKIEKEKKQDKQARPTEGQMTKPLAQNQYYQSKTPQKKLDQRKKNDKTACPKTILPMKN
jgi:hypothetical protein